MLSLLDWLLPIQIQDELSIARIYSKINPYILFEVIDLVLTKPRIKKSFVNQNIFKNISDDVTDIYFYLALKDIPKLQQKVIEPTENKSKLYRLIIYCIFFLTQLPLISTLR